MSIITICICGAGTMGSGIAQVCAMAGKKVIQFDVNPTMLEKSREHIEQGLQYLVTRGKLSVQEKESVTGRILFTANIEDCKADLIIEAIIEQKEAKTGLFGQLSAINSPDTIFATNTSSISIDAMAADMPDPSKLAGMHFFNPAPVMKLVEIVQGAKTSPGTITAIISLAQEMGKIPVLCKDSPGFIVNRVARPYYLEAMKMVEEGSATIETIDALMEASGFKMGPFRLMDLIGLDINYNVSTIVWEAMGKPLRLMPSDVQGDKVKNGQLGKKSGAGFYQY